MRIMRTRTFNRLMRERELKGHRIAFAEFEFADRVILGPCVIRDSEVNQRIAILGDDTIVARCIFKGDSDDGVLLELR